MLDAVKFYNVNRYLSQNIVGGSKVILQQDFQHIIGKIAMRILVLTCFLPLEIFIEYFLKFVFNKMVMIQEKINNKAVILF